jgi:hypothetical protein
MKTMLALLALALALALPAQASQHTAAESGQVSVPLSEYTKMLSQLSQEPRPAPAAYAIGSSSVEAAVRDRDGRKTATVNVTVQIEIFEDEWTLAPVLPAGVALGEASVDGRAVRLVERAGALYWSANKAGVYSMRLRYDVDAQQYSGGRMLSLAIPRAAATRFTLTFPEAGVDLSVAPSADLNSSTQDGATRLTATIPATSMILVSWRDSTRRPFAVSRASYTGELGETAIAWKATFQVELFSGALITLPVMPMGVTMSDLRVDGEAATLLEQDGFFATLLQGRGVHQVEVDFEVPVVVTDGPPRAGFRIPRVPVSQFDLVLPGRKDVRVSPGADVRTTELENATRATSFIPMGDQVAFSWSEAIPEDLRGQLRANASLYHAVFAEEGVLHGEATVVYEITHGDASQLELEVPADAQVNSITAPEGGVSDWVVAQSETPGRKRINVFLERPASGDYRLEVSYERLLGAGVDAPVAVPLLSAAGVHRQRGMVALLSGPELALEPESAAGASRVGENQLPAFIRNRITMTVAHTFKYIEAIPDLRVRAVAPERKQGQFDARVDTLISLGDVTMKGSATVEVDVKSGAILELRLLVPANVNVLGVAGPSLRNHEVRDTGDGQTIELAFTRDMEGQFRVEVNYERIMEGDAMDVVVPTISVAEAEVEHGRVAVEALTAVEVRATTVERLSSLDINELPQQLVLKTSNPILLAYRYVNAKPPFRLALKITRHQEIDVQVAAIERADYRSLITRDGLSVTTARLTVRNSRRQFLRLALPPGSKVWSVFVDGKPEKPAYAAEQDSDGEPAVLVRMINSAQGFPVDIVYETPVQSIDTIGKISNRLPRPDMIVTNSRWDVFLPVGPRYIALDGPMDLVVDGALVTRRVATELMTRASDAYQAQMGQPLRINVPAKGVRFTFEKLYASQSPEDAGYAIRYVSSEVNLVGVLLSALGVVLLWVAVVALASGRIPLRRQGALAVVIVGVALLVGAIGYLGTSPVPASALAILIAVMLGLWVVLQRILAWRRARLAA